MSCCICYLQFFAFSLWMAPALSEIGHHQRDLIALISNRLNAKAVLFLSESESAGDISDGAFGELKYLSNTLTSFSSVWTLESLEKNGGQMKGSRAMVVFHDSHTLLSRFPAASRRIKLARFAWLFISLSSGVNLTHFAGAFIPYDSQFLYASYESEQFTIREVYQTSEDSEKRVDYYGRWSESEGLAIDKDDDLYGRRTNFHRGTFKYMLYSINPDPYNPCTMLSFEETTTLECLFYQVWNDFSVTFNFTSDVQVSPPIGDLSLGVYVQRMLEKIHAGDVDSSVIPLMMTSARVARNVFLWPMRSTSFFVFTKVPEPEINFASYLRPFGFNLWLAVIAWLVSFPIVAVSFKLAITSLTTKKEFSLLTDSADDITASFSALCAQGITVDQHEDMVSLRMLLILAHMVPLFLLPSYSGALITFLGNPPSRLPFTNLKEFEDSGRYKLTSNSPSFDHTFLKTGDKFSGVREKNLLLDESEFPKSDERGFELVCGRKVSFFVGQPVLMKDPPGCKVFNLDESFGIFVSAIAVSDDFPLKEQFNRVLVRRFSRGVRFKHEEKIVLESLKIDMILISKRATKAFFQKANFESTKPFTLEDVLPIFAVFSIGLTFTFIIFSCEKLKYRRTETVHS